MKKVDQEKLVISRIGCLLDGGTTIFALVTAAIPFCTNVACAFALHWIVKAICVQGNMDFCTPSGCGIAGLNWLCVCCPGPDDELFTHTWDWESETHSICCFSAEYCLETDAKGDVERKWMWNSC